jgi:TATA-binding protein-associated factor
MPMFSCQLLSDMCYNLFFRQLLQDCGIGLGSSIVNNLGDYGPIVNQHRVLLFCQLKSMLDIVENDLLK